MYDSKAAGTKKIVEAVVVELAWADGRRISVAAEFDPNEDEGLVLLTECLEWEDERLLQHHHEAFFLSGGKRVALRPSGEGRWRPVSG